jgi:putative acyl-CoA dehydrogenase
LFNSGKAAHNRLMNSPVSGAEKVVQRPLNQPPSLTNYNLFLSDLTLKEALERHGAAWAAERIAVLGRILGTDPAQQWGVSANENPPVLHTHDRFGARRDEVVFHPAWHNLMQLSIEHQLHSLPWLQRREGAQVARAAQLMITAQNEAGHTCPISMTFSGVAALHAEPDLLREWQQKILSSTYDARFAPASEKSGVLLGMGMTEKQGGSDVRANVTRAERIGNSREYLITGHKWFCSAPMCDAFLVLAQADKGLSCFFLPRWTPTGEKNNFFIQRLKDKMGNRSNASSEVEFQNAWARLVGEEGRGVATIIEMVNYTRLDCAVAAAALMRQALAQAMHHCRYRKVFGNRLIEQPLMRNVLADLALESEAATLLAMRLAAAFDARESSESERAFARIATAISKFWLCKRAPFHVGEALECLGGNGYVEESMMPRLYREAPLYSIWEGSGNVICLDILRALSREPSAAEALVHEFRSAREAGDQPRLSKFLDAVESELARAAKGGAGASEAGARRLAEDLGLALQASLMVRYAPEPNANLLIRARLGEDRGSTFGTLPETGDLGPILDRIASGLAYSSR